MLPKLKIRHSPKIVRTTLNVLDRIKKILDEIQGYHFGVLFCAGASAVVFLINLTITIWASRAYEITGGLGIVQDGSCSKTNTLATWLHLAINVLSTLLLGCSNYTMQCLSSPTRQEIDKAHKKGTCLDIGIPGTRNLLKISRKRLALWCLVAVSSIPLHLLYNSAVFTTLSAREYSIFLIRKSFLQGQPFDVGLLYASEIYEPTIVNGDLNILDGKSPTSEASDNVGDPSIQSVAEHLQLMQKSLQRLESESCVQAYSATFISTRSDVLLVAAYDDQRTLYESQSNSLVHYLAHDSPRFQNHDPGYAKYWMCDSWDVGSNCSTNIHINATHPWLSNGEQIEYCLSQPVDEHCKVQFSIVIMVIVTTCNFVKMIIMSLIAWKRPTEPLVTLGDTIASFLDEPDPETRGNCLAGWERFQESRDWGDTIATWRPRQRRWLRATSGRRFVYCNFM